MSFVILSFECVCVCVSCYHAASYLVLLVPKYKVALDTIYWRMYTPAPRDQMHNFNLNSLLFFLLFCCCWINCQYLSVCNYEKTHTIANSIRGWLALWMRTANANLLNTFEMPIAIFFFSFLLFNLLREILIKLILLNLLIQ